jgi:phosphatidate cytidylyltransferase
MKSLPELTQRIYTAIPLLGIAIAATFYFHSISFLVCNTLLMWCVAWEWVHIHGRNLVFFVFYATALLLGCVGLFWLPQAGLWSLSMLMGIALVGYVMWLIIWKRSPSYSLWMLDSIGAIYLMLNWHSLFLLKKTPLYLSIGLLTVVLTDTLAYFIGRYWGVHRLPASINLQKTWEGCLGGLMGPIALLGVTAWLSGYLDYINHQMTGIIVLTALIAITGDLFESAVKRHYGVKDSGGGLPGHGGWLDRCDGLVCAMPVFSAGLFYLGVL